MTQKTMKAVFAVIDDDKLEKSIFRRVGNAFVNRDDSLTVLLDAFPARGNKLHIRDIEPKSEEVQ